MADAPDIVVYGGGCPACTQAKEILRRHGLGFAEREIRLLPRTYGRVRSMPQITIDGEPAGGIDALLRMARSGALKRLAAGEAAPWTEIRRRRGRGYDVVERDRLGRVTRRTRVATRSVAEELVQAAGVRTT